MDTAGRPPLITDADQGPQQRTGRGVPWLVPAVPVPSRLTPGFYDALHQLRGHGGASPGWVPANKYSKISEVMYN
jgi:hypothetical protein